ncbi:MAG: hypothetical protein IT355_03730 [Gemmatimonadaceae bacterium]|nr:hypothetical protein [Gemmatimonadaceae bacterium]
MTEPMALAADALWAPLVDAGTQWCAPNVHADAAWLDVGGQRWRVAVTKAVPGNSYVVSAAGQYLDYAREETRRIPSRANRTASRGLLAAVAPVVRALDPVVILDALPVSTVLHPVRPADAWHDALAAARASFPSQPVMVRSLDAVASRGTLETLRALGMALIPSRIVFHQDPGPDAFWQARNLRHDLALQRRAPMPCRALTPGDAAHIESLYWQLYGDKHSRLNPRFTRQWLAHGMTAGVFEGEGIEHDRQLVGVYLSYTIGGVMTNPVFGYDTSLPQPLGLYRRLGVLALQAARRKGLVLHASSGAPAFKATRGGAPSIEYHAVDLRGVRGVQRMAWETVLRIARAVGPAMMRRAT